MIRNTAYQRWRVFAFNASTNVPVLGDAANSTAKISKDYAEPVALSDINPVETEDGYYLFDLLQAETDARNLALYPESSTPGVQVIGVPWSYTTKT